MTLIACLLMTCLHAAGKEPEYGLHIQTYPLPNAEFTTLALDNGNNISFKGETLTMDFKLWARPENVLGTVFRVITDNNRNVDLVFSVGADNQRFPMLVTGDGIHTMQQPVKQETWLPVSLTIDADKGRLKLSFGEQIIETNYPELVGAKGARISFGFCPFPGWILSDIASVNLKDIKLTLDKKKIRLWHLGCHDGNTCYDEVQRAPAKTTNGNWMLDRLITWKKLYAERFDCSPSIAFDPAMNTFYIAMDSKELYVFHATERVSDTLRIRGGEMVANYPNQMIYLEGKGKEKGQLLSFNLTEQSFSPFDPDRQVWKSNRPAERETEYWNNSMVWNPADKSLISFGGYAQYHYNNKLISFYPFSPEKEPSEYTLTEIAPRHSSASILVGDMLYIFGGRGCPTGRQELSPRNYYDFYSVNLTTRQVTKYWELEGRPEHGEFTPGENLIYDKENDCFYAFASQRGGILIKINKKEARMEQMSLPIGIQFDSHYLYSDLFYSPTQKKLYVVTHKAQVLQKNADIDIYELAYPPIPASMFVQTAPQAEASSESDVPDLVIWCAVLLILISLIYYYIRKRQHGKGPTASAATAEKATASSAATDEEKGENKLEISANEPEALNNYDFSRQCVCFFGGFKVIDRNGADITMSFTPILKYLLILLILYTAKDSKGINGNKLIQLLWFDKSEESAKNNRNVYMSKLRTLLSEVGDVKIGNKNGFWNIQFENGTLCDYMEAQQLYREHDSKNLEKLLELLLRGVMLPNVETEWVDTFKNQFSDSTIDLLSRIVKQEELSDNMRLKVADVLFQHDCISEEALQVKCRILCKQGKKGLAKTIYDTFCKEYLTILNTEYPHTLTELIGE